MSEARAAVLKLFLEFPALCLALASLSEPFAEPCSAQPSLAEPCHMVGHGRAWLGAVGHGGARKGTQGKRCGSEFVYLPSMRTCRQGYLLSMNTIRSVQDSYTHDGFILT